ncbi:hypothetical protein Trihar35433_2077 [Trichoderma harzianum]|nr:hypothetical protein Trihar35433_2077 [Trichoderma harzianum]
MADDCSEKQLNTEGVDKNQVVNAETLSSHASSKTWSDRSSDSRSTHRGSRLSPVSRDPTGVDFDVITVHGIRDNYKTAWERENGSRWISDTLFKETPVREVDYGYDIDEDARLYEPDGIEFHAEDLIKEFSKFRHPPESALRLALINHHKYGNIPMQTTAIIFLGTPHWFQSTQDAEDQLHDLLLSPGPEIRTGVLGKIRNLAIQLKRINDSFLDTKILSHAAIFNIIVQDLLGHAFEASGRYIIDVADAVRQDGEPQWAHFISNKLHRVGCSVDMNHKMLQLQTFMLSLAPSSIGLDTPFDQTQPLSPVLNWIKEQKQYTNFDKVGTGFRFLHLHANQDSLADIKGISRLLYLHRDSVVQTPARSTIYFEFDQWDARYNNISSMLIYVMSTIISRIFKTSSSDSLSREVDFLSEMHAWSLEDVYNVYRLLPTFDLAPHALTIFISCFDQCSTDQRRWFLERILEEQRYSDREYRLIFSSSTRDSLDIEAFPDTAAINIDDCPSMRNLKAEHGQELLLELEELLRKRPIYQTFQLSLKGVLEQCEYTPFLGHCILNWFREFPRGKQKAEIAEIIHGLSPVTAENTVRVMISSLGEERKTRAEKIFNWIKHAAEPWTLESLSEALLMDECYDKEPFFSDIDPQSLAAEMMESFGGIITVKNRDVKFIHPSCYAIPELGLDGDNNERAAQVNCSIAKVCLRYLQLKEVHKALDELSSAVVYRNKDDEALIDTVVISRPRTSLVEYAVQFWPHHYKASANIKPRHFVHELFTSMESRRRWETLFWLLADPIIRPKRSYISEMPTYAMLGLEDFVDSLLETRIRQPFFQLDCWFTISEAARAGHSTIVDKLLRHVSVDEEELKNALCWAAGQRSPDTVKLLVDKVPDLKIFGWPERLFHRASSIGLNDLLTIILQSTYRDDSDEYDRFSVLTAISNAVFFNYASSIEILLASDPKPDLCEVDPKRGDLLTWATRVGTPHTVKILLEAGGALREKSNLIRTAVANYRPESLKIIKAGIDFVSGEEDEDGKISVRPHLLIAATRGATECVRTLLSHATKPDILGTVSSALYAAVGHEDIDIARLLLDYEPTQDLNEQFPDKRMFLSMAIESGNTELVSMMIQHGAEVNAVDPNFVYAKTPLSLAVWKGHLEIVKLLIRNGADINYSGGTSYPPLIVALMYGDKESVEYILQNEKVDVHQVAHNGINALISAVKYPPIVRELLSKGLPIDHESAVGTALFRAAAFNLPETVELLIKHNPKPDLECVFGQHTQNAFLIGYTALQVACHYRHPKCVKLLVDAGADVSFRNSNGKDALDILLAREQSSKRAEDCLRLLLFNRNGIDAAYVNEKRQTRLHFIQRRTRVSIVELLAAAMAPIDTQDEDGYTPLAIAVREGNSSVARYLVERGANVNVFGAEFGSISHIAVTNGDLSLVKFLMDAGADREAVDPNYGKSLLYSALDIDDDRKLERMVKYLVDEVKVPINKFGGYFGYPIIMAASSVGNHDKSSIRILKLLIRRKAEVNVADSQGRTALHIACGFSPIGCIKALVEAGANVDTKDKVGRLPIHIAAGIDSTDSTDVVTYLLDQCKDMDINVADQDGWTPLMWAARSGSADVITMLAERGADVWVRGRASGAGGEWSALRLMNFSDENTELRHLLEPKELVRVTSEGIQEEWDSDFHEIKPGDRKSYECDSCFMDVVGRQWKCVDCSDDFSLCFKCFDHRSELHDSTHNFQAIEPLYREEDSVGDEDAAAKAKNSDGEDFDLDGDY